MQEQVISFETSKLAKEKGFPDIDCTRYYVVGGVIVSANWVDIYEPKEYYPIVAQSLLQKWIRDSHAIHIELEWYEDSSYEGWLVSDIFKDDVEYAECNVKTYEECLEICLLNALYYIK